MKQKIKMSTVHKYAKSRLGYSCGQCISPYETAKKALELDGFKFPSAVTFRRWVIINYDYIVIEASKIKSEIATGTTPVRTHKAKRNPKQAPKLKPSTQSSVQAFISHSGIDPTSNDFLLSFEWRALRLMALKKHGAVCQCCGASPATGAVMNVDHVKPRKFFPELALSLENLQVLCSECNHGKGNWDMTDFRQASNRLAA